MQRSLTTHRAPVAAVCSAWQPSASYRYLPSAGARAAQVFDDKATFAEWFGDALGKGAGGAGAGGGGAGDEWLEREKRVVVIHRLHQILEPFMLRRQVADVEGRLPPKVLPPFAMQPSWFERLCCRCDGERTSAYSPSARASDFRSPSWLNRCMLSPILLSYVVVMTMTHAQEPSGHPSVCVPGQSNR